MQPRASAHVFYSTTVTRRGWVLFATMGLIWGIPYLLIKVAVEDLSPATLVCLRTTIGALVLLPIALARGGLGTLARSWRAVVAYTLAEVTLPWWLLADAERRLSSSLAGLLIAAVPLLALVLAWVSGADERLDGRRLLGLLVGFLGVGALLGLDLRGDLAAVGEVGLVVAGYAVGPMIVVRRLARVSTVGVVAASLVVTAIVYAPLAVAQRPASLPAPSVLAAVVVLAVLCTALAFVLYFALITEVGTIRAQTITYVNPAVALVLGVAILGEPFTLGAAVGFCLIVVGLLLATRRAAPLEPAAVAVAVPQADRGTLRSW
jgi:drug/metabolite transporter (DMT)-like permease